MISIVSSNVGSAQLKEFRKWVEAEWCEVDSFEGENGSDALPPPILALDHEKLVGGLSFTYSVIPETCHLVLWINTLLVTPPARGNGIGSKLIQAAEELVARIGIEELYVYTDIPGIYQKLDWEVLGTAGNNEILKKRLIARSKPPITEN